MVILFMIVTRDMRWDLIGLPQEDGMEVTLFVEKAIWYAHHPEECTD